MKNEHIIHEHIIRVLREKIPHGPTLTNNITDWLLIDKDAVYRRLRGEVPFSFSEIVIIADKLDVSLDYFIDTSFCRNVSFQMQMVDFINPSESAYKSLEEHARIIRLAQNFSHSEYAESATYFPLNIYTNYRYLTRYYLFKWSYRSNMSTRVRTYGEIEVPERLACVYKELTDAAKCLTMTRFLWDYRIFEHHVSDILYFKDLGLITEEETRLIKNDLLHLLDYMEDICRKGKYEETGNHVFIYISDISHETTCSFLEIPGIYYSLFTVFTMNTITSLDRNVFNWTKNWVYSLLRTSTMITGNNDKQRMSFVNKQREIISTL